MNVAASASLAAGYTGLLRVTTVQLARDLQRASPPDAVIAALDPVRPPQPAGSAGNRTPGSAGRGSFVDILA